MPKYERHESRVTERQVAREPSVKRVRSTSEPSHRERVGGGHQAREQRGASRVRWPAATIIGDERTGQEAQEMPTATRRGSETPGGVP